MELRWTLLEQEIRQSVRVCQTFDIFKCEHRLAISAGTAIRLFKCFTNIIHGLYVFDYSVIAHFFN
jgi:hypothetical protein